MPSKKGILKKGLRQFFLINLIRLKILKLKFLLEKLRIYERVSTPRQTQRLSELNQGNLLEKN